MSEENPDRLRVARCTILAHRSPAGNPYPHKGAPPSRFALRDDGFSRVRRAFVPKARCTIAWRAFQASPGPRLVEKLTRGERACRYLERRAEGHGGLAHL